MFYGLTFPETLRNLPHSIFLLRRQGMIHEANFRFCVFLSAFYIVEMYSFTDNRIRCHPSAMQCRKSPWMWLSERCVPVSLPTTKRIRTKAEKIKEGEPLQPETLREKNYCSPWNVNELVSSLAPRECQIPHLYGNRESMHIC